MIPAVLAASGAAAAVVLATAAGAVAADAVNCSDFASPVVIVNGYDPAHLDADHDGIGCDDNPGDPVTTDLYADLRDEGDSNPPPSLAATGPADYVHRHPVRSIGVGVVLVAAGGGLVLAARRRKDDS